MLTSRHCWILLLPVLPVPALAQPIPTRPISQFHVLGGDGTVARVSGTVVTDDRHVFLLDGGDFNIKAYDPKGALVRTMGRQGRGPGEFANPVVIRREDSILVVTDRSNGIVRYSLNGQHVSTQRREAQNNVYRMRYGAHLNVVRGIPSISPANRLVDTTIVLEIVYRSGKRDTVARMNLDWSRWQVPGRPTATRPTGFGHDKVWAALGDSMVVVADGYTGEVTWHAVTERGTVVARRSSLQLESREVTSADIARQEQYVTGNSFSLTLNDGKVVSAQASQSGKLLDVPRRWSVASRSFASPDGTVWFGAPLTVRKSHKGQASIRDVEIQNNTWTAFPAKGHAFRITLPSSVLLVAINGNRLYCVPLDEDDRVIIYTF